MINKVISKFIFFKFMTTDGCSAKLIIASLTVFLQSVSHMLLGLYLISEWNILNIDNFADVFFLNNCIDLYMI